MWNQVRDKKVAAAWVVLTLGTRYLLIRPVIPGIQDDCRRE
jgi:hypothetical protein